jgi:hypothetical protein
VSVGKVSFGLWVLDYYMLTVLAWDGYELGIGYVNDVHCRRSSSGKNRSEDVESICHSLRRRSHIIAGIRINQ